MAEDEPISEESRLFEIARLLVEFRYRAEVYWTDADTDPERGSEELEPLAVVVRQLTVAALAGADVMPGHAAGRLGAFVAAVNGFWTNFRSEWPRAARVDKLKRTADVDPEQAYFRDRYMFAGSPLADPAQWGVVQAAADEVAAAAGPGPRGCFKLSALLGGEVWPTFAGGQRGREAESHLAFLAVDFAVEVRQALQSLVQFVPILSGVEVDFRASSSFYAHRQVNDLWRRIEGLLRHPQDAPGYLGLVLDRPAGRVCRAGKCVPLNGTIGWEVLARLVRGGDDFCSRDNLGRAWGAGNYDAPSPEALDQVLTELRQALGPLRIRIRNSRNVGWRLEDASEG